MRMGGVGHVYIAHARTRRRRRQNVSKRRSYNLVGIIMAAWRRLECVQVPSMVVRYRYLLPQVWSVYVYSQMLKHACICMQYRSKAV